MKTPDRRYVIPPDDCDRGWPVTLKCRDALRAAAAAARRTGERMEVVVRAWSPPVTDAQRKTLWMWHGEVASELTLRTGVTWGKQDVHELIFLERFMPRRELFDPDTGEIISRPMRTSDPRPPDEERSAREILTEAMDAYLAWIYGMGMEVTVPQRYDGL